jgi:Ran GTPase-activating protein (RanGAP) involved in mRNA processing and transport
MSMMAATLKPKRLLTKIMLDYNKIGAEGAMLLSEGLMDNETLTNLNLSSCLIMQQGALALAQCLANKK